MVYSVNMEIAGINFAISCEQPVILHEYDAAYQAFFRKAGKGTGSADVDIRLEWGNMPDTEKMTRIFDTGQSWSMFQDDGVYYLSFNSRGIQPIWLARFTDDFREVAVYCGDQLVNEEAGRIIVSNPVRYPLDQILLMYILSRRQGALLHAAGIDIGGKGFIFPGKSGAGKSTISRQFIARKNMDVLSDDRIVVRKIDGTYKAFGTPWPGDAGIALDRSVRLSGIFFLNHGDSNSARKLKPQEALEWLLPVTSIPWYDREVMPGILMLCEDLITRIPAFELSFKPSHEIADFFEEFVSTSLLAE